MQFGGKTSKMGPVCRWPSLAKRFSFRAARLEEVARALTHDHPNMVKIELVVVRLFPHLLRCDHFYCILAEGILLEVAVSGFSRPDGCGCN